MNHIHLLIFHFVINGLFVLCRVKGVDRGPCNILEIGRDNSFLFVENACSEYLEKNDKYVYHQSIGGSAQGKSTTSNFALKHIEGKCDDDDRFNASFVEGDSIFEGTTDSFGILRGCKSEHVFIDSVGDGVSPPDHESFSESGWMKMSLPTYLSSNSAFVVYGGNKVPSESLYALDSLSNLTKGSILKRPKFLIFVNNGRSVCKKISKTTVEVSAEASVDGIDDIGDNSPRMLSIKLELSVRKQSDKNPKLQRLLSSFETYFVVIPRAPDDNSLDRKCMEIVDKFVHFFSQTLDRISLHEDCEHKTHEEFLFGVKTAVEVVKKNDNLDDFAEGFYITASDSIFRMLEEEMEILFSKEIMEIGFHDGVDEVLRLIEAASERVWGMLDLSLFDDYGSSDEYTSRLLEIRIRIEKALVNEALDFFREKIDLNHRLSKGFDLKSMKSSPYSIFKLPPTNSSTKIDVDIGRSDNMFQFLHDGSISVRYNYDSYVLNSNNLRNLMESLENIFPINEIRHKIRDRGDYITYGSEGEIFTRLRGFPPGSRVEESFTTFFHISFTIEGTDFTGEFEQRAQEARDSPAMESLLRDYGMGVPLEYSYGIREAKFYGPNGELFSQDEGSHLTIFPTPKGRIFPICSLHVIADKELCEDAVSKILFPKYFPMTCSQAKERNSHQTLYWNGQPNHKFTADCATLQTKLNIQGNGVHYHGWEPTYFVISHVVVEPKKPPPPTFNPLLDGVWDMKGLKVVSFEPHIPRSITGVTKVNCWYGCGGWGPWESCGCGDDRCDVPEYRVGNFHLSFAHIPFVIANVECSGLSPSSTCTWVENGKALSADASADAVKVYCQTNYNYQTLNIDLIELVYVG